MDPQIIVNEICSEMSVKNDTLENLVVRNDLPFLIEFCLNLRAKGRFLTAITKEQMETGGYMDKPICAARVVSPKFYKLLEQKKRGLSQQVYDEAVKREKEDPLVLYLKNLGHNDTKSTVFTY